MHKYTKQNVQESSKEEDDPSGSGQRLKQLVAQLLDKKSAEEVSVCVHESL